MNQVVARYQNGKTLKGMTNDFLPGKNQFHVTEDGVPPGSKPREILVADLKALYFVRSLAGDPKHEEDMLFPAIAPGRKVHVEFKDGEVMLGTTQGFHPDKPGFFLVPADTKSNNERCFVVLSATKSVRFI